MVRKFGLVTLVLSGLIGVANAADVAPEPPVEPDWVFTAAGYVWLSGIDGSVASFGAPETDIDLSISDVLKNFEVGLMGAGEARHGRFLLATDFMWAKLSADNDLLDCANVELTARF